MGNFFGKYVLGIAVPLFLIGLGLFFLFYLRFFFILKPKKTFSRLFCKSHDGKSGFSAMTVALAGTLGVGNIVGVASALILGGAGAIFWMWISALAAMVLKYAEIVLAHSHRRSVKGESIGGAMYYIEDYFGRGFGKILGSIFAILCLVNSLSMGCMLQSRAVSSAFVRVFPTSEMVIGILLAAVCGAVIIRGIHDISPLTSIIIPIMTILYVIMSFAVIIKFYQRIDNVFLMIIKDAFSARSAAGGTFGFLLSSGVRYGCMRGILSNEAGCGTAPIAHAASKINSAAEQGIWGIVEVFVDTILLCTMTALSILLAFGDKIYAFSEGEEMKLVISAYGEAIGKSSAPLMLIMVFFFAFATIICWAYYGRVTLMYLTGNPTAENIFKTVYILCIFAGAVYSGNIVWEFSDFAMGCMTIINLTVLFLMRGQVFDESKKVL
ncbi:MAG: amino acid carrier protein [Clostridia bacterium]|nr:amino acid carrier protein [Clostridia bacterium]